MRYSVLAFAALAVSTVVATPVLEGRAAKTTAASKSAAAPKASGSGKPTASAKSPAAKSGKAASKSSGSAKTTNTAKSTAAKSGNKDKTTTDKKKAKDAAPTNGKCTKGAAGDGGWICNENGNVDVKMSDSKVHLESVTIDQIAQKVSDSCKGGGDCDFSGAKISGYEEILAGGRAGIGRQDVTVTVTAIGYLPQDGTEAALINALKGALNSVRQCQETPFGGSVKKGGGPQWCQIPNFISVAMKGGENANHIGVTISQSGAGDGFCSTFATIGSAVAGAVDAASAGAASAAFSLAGLFCGAS